MSHKIYTTEAVILGSRDFGEANRWYFLLTPDFGLVVARAQGVREQRSKLRGHLSCLNHAQISLVRGREYWRLINAEDTRALEEPRAAPVRAAALRVVGLLKRLLPEAQADPGLFSRLKLGLAELAAGPQDRPSLAHREAVLVWRLLHLLGYVAGAVPATTEGLVREINLALSRSQL
jgi:DNA repair protein RecO (recombination protein O)